MQKYPQSYYKEININEKANEIIRKFKKRYKVILHTNKELEYNYLPDSAYVIETINKQNNANAKMFIEINNGFKLSFGEWEKSFPNNLYGYNQLRTEIDIIHTNGDTAIISLYSYNNELIHTALGSSSDYNIGIHCELFDIFYRYKKYLKDIILNGGSIKITYWKKPYKSFQVHKPINKNDLTYITLQNTLYAFAGKKDVGICDYIEYNKDVLLLRYFNTRFIQNNLTNSFNSKILNKLEHIAKTKRYKKIITTCLCEYETKPFIDNGYKLSENKYENLNKYFLFDYEEYNFLLERNLQ